MRWTVGGLRAAFFMCGFALACAAHAHGGEKPKHGGIMGRGDDTLIVELVMERGLLTLYVEDHDSGKPIPAEKLKGAWVSVLGPGRPAQKADLSPAGGNKLTAQGLSPRVGDRVSARFILPDGMETLYIFNFR